MLHTASQSAMAYRTAPLKPRAEPALDDLNLSSARQRSPLNAASGQTPVDRASSDQRANAKSWYIVHQPRQPQRQ
eukprot:5500342-Pyramimonas_sp.AAC.1